MVIVGGISRHIVGYLQDFLFPPEQILAPVRSLSGGERNRLLLAKLFILPSNVLVLDEPTNDLDAETLELLEDRLLDYSGTVLLVSHDRAFLNNVVTSTIVFEGGGAAAGVRGRLRRLAPAADGAGRAAPDGAEGAKTKEGETAERKAEAHPIKRRGSWRSLPPKLEALEEEKQRLIDDPEFPRIL